MHQNTYNEPTGRQNEPRHYKTNKMSVRPTKTQISLGICPVRSRSVFAVCVKKAWVLSYPLSTSEDSEQTGRMPSLIGVSAGRTLILLVLSCRGSNVIFVRKFSIMFQTLGMHVSVLKVGLHKHSVLYQSLHQLFCDFSTELLDTYCMLD